MNQAICRKCGNVNTPSAKFCTKCGTSLILADTSPSASQTVSYPAGEPIQLSLYPSLDPNKARIERTKAGLLLLIIGVIIAALPVTLFFSVSVLLAGAVLVIIGRKAFEKKHQSYAIWSIFLYIIGLAVFAVSGLWFGISGFLTVSSSTSSNAAVEALSSWYNLYLVGIIAGEAIITSSYVLLTYALQRSSGRQMLWAGYAIGLGADALLLFLTTSRVSDAAREAVSNGTFDPAPLVNLPFQIGRLALLRLIPALVFASAYYLVWSSVRTGRVPVTPIGLTDPRIP